MSSEAIKCLSIQQPWAGLIVAGDKDVENRTWKTNYRGPLLIHASKKYDKDGDAWLRHKGVEIPEWCMAKGYIVGLAELTDCRLSRFDARHVFLSKWHEAGQFGFYLKNRTQANAVVPWKGRLGLFNVPLVDLPEFLRGQIEEVFSCER